MPKAGKEGEGSQAPTARQTASAVPGKPRLRGRSSAACQQCHKSKQRCAGPAKIPCHRCELHGLDCVFIGTDGEPLPPSELEALQAAAQGGGPLSEDLIREIKSTSRRMQTLEASLARIEGALLGARAGAGGTGGGSAASTSNGTAAGAGTSASAGAAAAAAAAAAASASHDDNNGANNGGGGFSNSSASDHVRLDGRHNPLDTVGEAIAIQALDTMQGDGTPAQDHHRHLHHDVGNLANDTADGVAGGGSGGANVDVDMDIPPDETESWAPDAVTRGFISLADCQALFDSFISNNGPWVFFLHPLVDAQAGVVRRRSPILFHTIILISLSYRPPNPANVSLYRAVSSLLDAILAPAIIAPQPEQLQTDFVRAMLLLLQFKPIQYNALALRGVRDPAVVEQRSRISVRSSFMMRGVILRASAFINLVSIAATFTRAFAQRDSLPIPVQVLIDLRTLYCQIWSDAHGSLQSGREPTPVPGEAVSCARLFASLNDQPSDTRLAAAVELASITSPVLSSARSYDDLAKFNADLDVWTDYWRPRLASLHDDPIAYTAMIPYAYFCRLTINATVFNRWKERKRQYNQSISGSPAFTALDYEYLGHAVRASEDIVFALSIESRTPNDIRTTRWPPCSGSAQYPRLHLDQEVAQSHMYANDSLTACIWPYPLILLCKLGSEGLMLPNLQLISAGNSPYARPGLRAGDKLARLLELGADFLARIAGSNPNHPAVRQSHFLRRLLDTGLSGRNPTVQSVPGSPVPHHMFTDDGHGGRSGAMSASSAQAASSSSAALVSTSSAAPTAPGATPSAPMLPPNGATPPAGGLSFSMLDLLPQSAQGTQDPALKAAGDPIFGDIDIFAGHGNHGLDLAGMNSLAIDWVAWERNLAPRD